MKETYSYNNKTVKYNLDFSKVWNKHVCKLTYFVTEDDQGEKEFKGSSSKQVRDDAMSFVRSLTD